MLPGVCPGCGLRADLDVFCAQADGKQALAAALELPASLAGRVLRYLRLFSPPSKALAMSKTTRLLIELAAAVKSAQVTRRGIAHTAPLGLWEAAIDTVVNQPPDSLPLNNHAYLFQVAWNLAERAASRQEQAAEDRLRRPRATDSPPSQGGVARSAGVVCPAADPLPSPPGRGAGGEGPLPPPPTDRPRVPPPADFRALLNRLGGLSAPTPTPTPTAEE